MIIHMIGNAHIDPVWLWRWPEGVSEMISTCRTMVEMLKNSDDLIFTKGEAMMYEWIEKTDPQLFDEIVKLVKSGRWNIVNGWWVQPDCNIPSGESFVRQSLYGKRYFKEKFGIDVKVGYNVDSFGHAATLPQILKKSGFDYYVFMRPGPNEKSLPSLFRWRSPDGSEVIAFRLSRNYETRRDKGDLERQIRAYLEDSSNLGSTMVFYGVGDHGGGPTIEDIDYIRKHKDFSDEIKLEFSSPDRFFGVIRDKKETLPVVEDELQYHSIGAYSVNSKMKILNRKSENALTTAERFSTIVSVVEGIAYPYDVFEKAWKSLLFNQFHDLLGGTAIKEAYEDAYNELGGVISDAEKIKHLSLQTLSKDIDTRGDGLPFVIFNPSAFEREEYVEFEPWLNWEEWDERILIDSDGHEVEYQKVHPTELMNNTYRILFKAKVPPLGYSVYWLKNGKPSRVKKHLIYGDGFIENEFYRLKLTDEGYINLYDKQKNIQYFSEPSCVPVVVKDDSDTWSHGISQYSREHESLKARKVKIENGKLESKIRIEIIYKRSKILEDITIHAGDPVIRVHFIVDWHESFKMLKLKYLFNEIKRVIAEVPYGMIERPLNGQEYPMQRGLFFENDNCSFTIVNNGKYAYDVLDNEARITLLRNPPYAWHIPYRIKRNETLYFTDEGIQEFDIWMSGYSPYQIGEGSKIARSLNEPLEIFSIPKHAGKFAPRNSFFEVNGEGVLLEALKMSESKDGSAIIRLWETTGTNRRFFLNAFGNSKAFSIKGHEIKSIRLKNGSFKEVDLLEK
ncbi:alpha-mannosidase [Athalassotoga sp.]|uniref:alpha-mannosidase n=2 Tax=Athalassotoga sp. TaxID=2022597 RepID=UPI003CFE4566